MKPFRFTLQPVRLLRERKEQTAQQNYANKLRAHESATAQLQQANRDLATAWDALCQELTHGSPAATLRRARAWCAALESRQQEHAAHLQQARRELEAASHELLNATRERQALDRLHDKHRDAHQREWLREEQKLLDEMGLRTSPNAELLRGWSPALQPATGT